MTDVNDEKIEELAKQIYANLFPIVVDKYSDILKQRVLAGTAFKAAETFYEYANDRNHPK